MGKAVADGLIAQLRALTLDRNTRVAFAALADARELLASYPGLIPVLRLGPMVCIEGAAPK